MVSEKVHAGTVWLPLGRYEDMNTAQRIGKRKICRSDLLYPSTLDTALVKAGTKSALTSQMMFT